jgi:hypothetical protein
MPDRNDAHRIGSVMGSMALRALALRAPALRKTALSATAICAMLAVVVLPDNPARAAGDCLAAPNAQPPPGSHWYYRSDRGKQRHCWYLAPEGERVGHAKPDAQPAARPVASAPVQPSLPAPRSETAADPTRTLLQGITYGSPGEAMPSVAQEPDHQAAGTADREPGETSTVQYVDTQDEVTQPPEVAASGAMTMPMRVLLLFVCAVAIAGLLQYAILRTMGVRRRQLSLEQARAKLSVSRSRERTPPVVAGARPNGLRPAPAEPIDPRDIQEGFRQILRAVERRAA